MANRHPKRGLRKSCKYLLESNSYPLSIRHAVKRVRVWYPKSYIIFVFSSFSNLRLSVPQNNIISTHISWKILLTCLKLSPSWWRIAEYAQARELVLGSWGVLEFFLPFLGWALHNPMSSHWYSQKLGLYYLWLMHSRRSCCRITQPNRVIRSSVIYVLKPKLNQCFRVLAAFDIVSGHAPQAFVVL